ncbi:thiol-disulfide isomerase/thioredoxin [Methanohalophilus levihalophilus]|uniref:thioredoxin family protein n=1 Tax=Methanohalophilus levihalophilus TaxID=1431282 RepID=UPI001AE2E798|nr:thioredoxin family protein [Methanohalophilus levihalophilus]MBP2029669.1 thiol-disulfide isomerase/thioredoxin [Methanohalophilus levihalophilus]
MTSGIIEANSVNWEGIINGEKGPSVVMFYLTTCPHCQNIYPYFQNFAQEFGDRVTFAKMNAEENPDISGLYGIMGTPTFIYFCKGIAIKSETGAVHPANLKRNIEELITGGEECVLKTTVLSHEISPYE